MKSLLPIPPLHFTECWLSILLIDSISADGDGNLQKWKWTKIGWVRLKWRWAQLNSNKSTPWLAMIFWAFNFNHDWKVKLHSNRLMNVDGARTFQKWEGRSACWLRSELRSCLKQQFSSRRKRNNRSPRIISNHVIHEDTYEKPYSGWETWFHHKFYVWQ